MRKVIQVKQKPWMPPKGVIVISKGTREQEWAALRDRLRKLEEKYLNELEVTEK